ncbi:hypothetical protein PVAND_014352 [Polypedilum vanderplanki]|uniref:Uncharacterized protein n=1 Tax=Polypedilum vanderplanki TaxID=319348 RepID=A0A9J6CT31_POLVA|nr:hypothetical protein PVAND_014352 [Polypedilum vanderplanki]
MHKFPNSAIPKSAKSVINMTYDYHLKVQEVIIYDIDSLIQCGKKFSISLDEWTSIGKNKYVNINLHFRNDEKMQYIKTGLVKINGKCTAEQFVQLVSECTILYTDLYLLLF